MNDRKTLTLVIVGLVVVAGGLVVMLIRSQHHKAAPTTTSAASQQELADIQVVADFTSLVATAPQDDRVVLYGDSLVSAENAGLIDGLQTGLHRTVEVVTTDSTSSTDALKGLRTVLQHPPKVLVMDIGRYDSSASVPLDRTAANLTLIAKKARDLGIVPVLLLGPSSDGATTYAQTIQTSLTTQTNVFDATQMLLTSKYRTSPSALNSDGEQLLGTKLVDFLTPLLKS